MFPAKRGDARALDNAAPKPQGIPVDRKRDDARGHPGPLVRPEEEVIQEAKDKVFPAVVFIKPIQQEFRGGKMEKIRDALGRIAVAPIFFSLDPVLKVVVQFLSIGKGVCRRLNDRCGERVAEFRPRLAAVHG